MRHVIKYRVENARVSWRWIFFLKHKYLSITLDNFAYKTNVWLSSNRVTFILLQVSRTRCRTQSERDCESVRLRSGDMKMTTVKVGINFIFLIFNVSSNFVEEQFGLGIVRLFQITRLLTIT